MRNLSKELSLFGLVMIVVGSVLGSGIFLTPSQIAAHISSPWLIILAWCLGGILTFSGALSFGELGGMFPKTGGVYVYLKEAYGNFIAFLYGWAYFTVIMSGTVAALAIAFSSYLSYIIPVSEVGKTLISISLVIVISIINIFRVKIVEVFSNAFSILKLAGIAIIIITGLILGSKSTLSVGNALPGMESQQSLSAFGLAMIGVLWSFGGWHHITFLSGEAKNPNRSIPLAMILGTSIVIVVYILTNLSYMFLLPVSTIATSDSIAADALSTVMKFGGYLIALLIALSTFGTALVGTLTGPRIYFAMAQDGSFFKGLSSIHQKYNTPVNAILTQGAWAIILLLVWGTFKAVITYVVFIDWIFFMLTAYIVILFRIKRRDVFRPYKTPLYPFTPILFILTSTLFIVNTLIRNPIYAGAGLGLLFLGLPFYLYFKRMK